MNNEDIAGQESTPHQEATIGETLWEIACHIFLVTGAFLIIFVIAVTLDLLITYLEGKHILKHNTPIMYALYSAKYMILFADIVLLSALVYKLTFRAIKKL